MRRNFLSYSVTNLLRTRIRWGADEMVTYCVRHDCGLRFVNLLQTRADAAKYCDLKVDDQNWIDVVVVCSKEDEIAAHS